MTRGYSNPARETPAYEARDACVGDAIRIDFKTLAGPTVLTSKIIGIVVAQRDLETPKRSEITLKSNALGFRVYAKPTDDEVIVKRNHNR